MRGARQVRRRRERWCAGALAALLLAVAVLVSGCGGGGSGGKSSSSSGMSRDQAAAPRPNPAATGSSASGSAKTDAGTVGQPSPGKRAVINVGQLQVRVRDVNAALRSAERLAGSDGGYVGSERTGTAATVADGYPDDTAPSDGPTLAPLAEPTDVGTAAARIELRVPAAHFDTDFARLGKLGTVLGRERAAQDVTEKVADVASRVKTQQASIARVRALMKQASSISEITALESALTTREAALESLQAEQRALRGQTALSTITMLIYARPAAAHHARHHATGVGTAAWHTLRGAWHALYLTGRGLFIALAAALPFLGALAVIGAIVWALRRRLRTSPGARDAADGDDESEQPQGERRDEE